MAQLCQFAPSRPRARDRTSSCGTVPRRAGGEAQAAARLAGRRRTPRPGRPPAGESGRRFVGIAALPRGRASAPEQRPRLPFPRRASRAVRAGLAARTSAGPHRRAAHRGGADPGRTRGDPAAADRRAPLARGCPAARSACGSSSSTSRETRTRSRSCSGPRRSTRPSTGSTPSAASPTWTGSCSGRHFRRASNTAANRARSRAGSARSPDCLRRSPDREQPRAGARAAGVVPRRARGQAAVECLVDLVAGEPGAGDRGAGQEIVPVCPRPAEAAA